EKIVDDINDLKKSMAEVGIEVDDYSSGGGVDLVGTAGTITTLAALEQELEIYNPQRINNFIINKDRLKALYENLSTATIEERLTLKGLESGREDLIVAGAAIARKVAEEFGFSILKVSDGGLLEGILLKEIWQTDGLGA
ncbi:MAG: exopolyphosphatase, partial [Deltaproteobacteria bacterium]|nr:exopolyphosphatase [Deltaproteobacteria bacterium]